MRNLPNQKAAHLLVLKKVLGHKDVSFENEESREKMG